MNVSYQHFVPGAPPRYTPESPYTVQTSPALVEANSLPIKTSCPTIITSLKADSLIPSTSLEKNGLSVPFMNMEKAPEYTETPGPSESTFPVVSLERTESRMDEVDLSESKSNQPNLLK
ncbi:hypothetical protein DICVIV_12709 [Dictyocaulus viviparus]|uniref:Uncharacterized protein n=1 Tax=Dictyocaulus viviparus TaxID=29172 RepID=A0A0D8X9Q5_DICVI|nr:hypothetical protein DICVIV_12709 [Dictyocaulus viviparus]